MHCYYARACPHSTSLLQLLQLLDVDAKMTDVAQGAPNQVLGTPAIIVDGKVYHGDHAFDLIDSMRCSQEPQPNLPPQRTEDPPAQSPSIVDPKAVSSVFDCEPIAPRK